MVRVLMPATPSRPYRVDLLLCGHHYRLSMTLAAPGCRRGEPYWAGLTSIFLTSSFFSTLRPTETVRMPWS